MLRLEIDSLDEIRALLDKATRAELEAWAKHGLPPVDPAFAPVASTFPAVRHEHVDLAPGLVLLVREDCEPAVRALAQEIYARFGPGRR